MTAQGWIDTLRWTSVTACVVAYGSCIIVLLNIDSRARMQSERRMIGRTIFITGTVLLLTSALFTEVGRVHHELTWRLPINLCGAILVCTGGFRWARR